MKSKNKKTPHSYGLLDVLSNQKAFSRNCSDQFSPKNLTNPQNTCKGKEYHTPWAAFIGCSSPLLRPWARRWTNHLSLWHMSTFVQCQSYDYLPNRRTLLPWERYQIILLGDRGTCVSKLAKGRLVTAKWPEIELATSQVASQHHNHYTTGATPHNTCGCY